MNKINLLIVVLITFNLSAQDPNSNLQLNTSGDYIRPGVSVMQINFNNSPTEFDSAKIPFPARFDEISFQNKFTIDLDIDGETDYDKDKDFAKKITDFVNKNISGQFISSFLGIEEGNPNWELLGRRANNSLTESQRSEISTLSSNLSVSTQNLLLDALIDNNYIIVIMPTGFGKIETPEELKTDFNTYRQTALVAVFKIDIADGSNIQAKKNLFMTNYSSDFSQVKSSSFPTELIYVDYVSGFANDQEYDGVKPSYEEIVTAASITTLDDALNGSSRKVDAFKPRSNVYNNKQIRLGTKEGLRVGDRYFSYQRELNSNGQVTLKRKGVDRVKYVGNNSINIVNASEEDLELIERSKLMLDSGKPTRTGYLSVYQPDLKLGLSVFQRLNPGIRFDARLDFIAVGFQAFLEVEIEESNTTLYTYDDYNTYAYENASAGIGYFGFQYYLGLSRTIDLVPFASFGIPSWSDEEGETIEIEGSIFNIGLRAPLKLSPSLQLIPEVTYLVFDDYGYDIDNPETKLFIGGALRFNF